MHIYQPSFQGGRSEVVGIAEDGTKAAKLLTASSKESLMAAVGWAKRQVWVAVGETNGV